jgi:hypothetical protein
MPHYTEKPGGLLHHQTLDPNLLGRYISTGEQISGTRHSHNHAWDKQAYPQGQTDPCPAKKKKKTLNNKEGTEKDMQQRGRVLWVQQEEERGKGLLSMQTFSKQIL